MSPGIPTRLLATQSDERLLALIREGHERAFEALVHRYRRPLLSYCRRLPLPDGRAEDVIQLALLRAWIAVREGAEVRDLKAWLYRVVHNTALNAARDAAHESEPVVDAPGSRLHPTAAPPDLDLRLRAREALAEVAALPALQREVMVRTAVAGHSHERVASDLGISDGAVRGLLYRARATVRRAATALTPPPLLSWLVGRMQKTPPTPERLTELAGGGGTVGFGGVLFKGGLVAVTASTALTGVAIVHLAGSPHRRARHQLVAVVPVAHGAAGPTATASAALTGVASTRPAGAPVAAGRVGRGSPGTPRAGHGLGAGAPAGAHALLRRTAGTSPSGGTRRAGTAPRGTVPGASTGGGGESAPPGGQPGQASGSGGDQSGSTGAASAGGSAGAPAPGAPSQTGQGSGEGSPPTGGAGSGGGAGSPGGTEGASSGSSDGGEAKGTGEEPAGGAPPPSGSGESPSLVGTVVKTVGGILEHVLH